MSPSIGSTAAPKSAQLVYFPSAPPQESRCEICRAEDKPDTKPTVDEVQQSANTGCQECSLRQIAVLHAKRTTGDKFMGEGPHTYDRIEAQLKGPLTRFYRLTKAEDGTYLTNSALAVLLYTRPGEPRSLWPSIGVSHEVVYRRLDDLSVLSEWMDNCRNSHPDCSHQQDNVALPSRVLDVGVAASEQIYILDSKGSTGTYAALSCKYLFLINWDPRTNTFVQIVGAAMSRLRPPKTTTRHGR